MGGIIEKISNVDNKTIFLIVMVMAVLNILTGISSLNCYNTNEGQKNEKPKNYNYLIAMMGFSIGALLFGGYGAFVKSG